MSSLNKVILIGRLGKEPELKAMTNGEAVANVSLATSEHWQDQRTGEKVERTEWHRVIFYRRQAEIVGEYLHKGALICVEGKLQTRKWQDKSGNDRYVTEIHANSLTMLGQPNTEPKPTEQPNKTAEKPRSKNAENVEPPFDDLDPPF